MKKNITIKDIAREAGVSVATVSYVLNNRTEERISEETRKKVLQIVNLLNYTPNQSAKALATNKSRNIAVYLPLADSQFKAAEQLHFLDAMALISKTMGYHLLHLCPGEKGPFDNVDAIICHDISTEEFYAVGDLNFVPLLTVDSHIGDPLFFQISSDIEKLHMQALEFFQSEEYTVVSLEKQNQGFKSTLENYFPSILYIKSIDDFSSIEYKNVFTFEQTLQELLPSSCNICYLPTITTNKLNKVMECVELAINRVQIIEHNIIL